ncbi:type VII secretion target [Actinokineospora sp. G85]|uniref:type VII secretion target n=1 Tax=Actinokineospora sp. G85 TaxID=3406626 RepID=UPI003C776D53
MGEVRVVPEELRGYAGLLERNATHFSAIEGHARAKGGDTSGFTGLLALLVPVVDGAVGLYAETLKFGHDKMAGLHQSLVDAADAYERADTASARGLDGVRGVSDIPAVGGN